MTISIDLIRKGIVSVRGDLSKQEHCEQLLSHARLIAILKRDVELDFAETRLSSVQSGVVTTLMNSVRTLMRHDCGVSLRNADTFLSRMYRRRFGVFSCASGGHVQEQIMCNSREEL